MIFHVEASLQLKKANRGGTGELEQNGVIGILIGTGETDNLLLVQNLVMTALFFQ
jgi:hypothetical protein